MKHRVLILCIFHSGLFSCVSMSQDPKEPDAITAKTDTEEALQSSLDHGGDVLLKTKEQLQLRNEWFRASAWLKNRFEKDLSQLSDRQLINAVNLYIACSDPKSTETFLRLNKSDRQLAHRLSWMIATSLSSPAMAETIEGRISELLQSNLLDLQIMPEMANAIHANRLKSSYTVLREGLMTQGDQAFAEAMVTLNPQRASEDFLVYLGQASFEDLRQISIPKINMMTATTIFEHFYDFQPSIAHPDFSALFLYSVSRNRILGEMANKIISTYLPAQANTMALILSGMEEPVQMAFLEYTRRNMTAELRLFMEELRNVSAHAEIVEEINALL